MENSTKNNTQFKVTIEEYDRLNSDPKLMVEGRTVSVTVIKEILKNKLLYDYTYDFFKGLNSEFLITYNYSRCLKYSRHTIIKAMEEAFSKSYLNQDDVEKYLTLKEITSEKTFINTYADYIYNITIDGINYDIPVRNFITLLNSENDVFLKLVSGNDTEIFGVPKAQFIYALVSFIKEKEILTNYELNSTFKSRFVSLSRSSYVDIQALNRYTQTEDVLHKQININPELREAILKDMPNELTLLEKAIYIYIKMCQILSYDDEYYVESKYNTTKNHSDIGYIQNITPSNSKVVCFEFNIIYARLLSELGINIKSQYINSYTENYGNSHVFLEYRVGKFLINADSVRTILQSDMYRAKAGLSLRTIECLNSNLKTQSEFKEALAKVYSIVLKQRGKSDNEINFNKLEAQYREIHDSVEIPLEEKLDILLTKVNDAALLGVDALSYILTLKDVIFNGYETNNNIFYVIIRSKLNPVDNQNAMASAIFTINTLGLGEDYFANRYFYYTPGVPLRELTKEELEYYFEEGIFAYIETGSPVIPGLSVKR